MLNRVVLIGRLTADPTLKYTPSGKAVAQFTLAVGRRFKKEETDFFPVEVWGKPAETAAQYLVKGSQAAVEGRGQIDKYTGKEGEKKERFKVVADQIEFLGKSTKDKEEHNEWDELGQEINPNSVSMPL